MQKNLLYRLCQQQNSFCVLFLMLGFISNKVVAIPVVPSALPVSNAHNQPNVSNVSTVATLPATLNSLNNTMPQKLFPSCNMKDYYWSEQSGNDYATIPAINSKDAVVEADSVTGRNNGVHYANGNVAGYMDDKTIVADWLVYDQNTAHAVGGNIVMARQYDVIHGKWVDYYMNLDSGYITDATATNAQTNMFASGKQIIVTDKKHYQVRDGYFTTCNPNNPDWSIRSKTTDFDYQDSQGHARNAVLYVKSVPVMEVPWLAFPLGERKSGFLQPEFGNNDNSGYFMGLPYYWNILPNYDMTIQPKFYTTDGFMITDQFRYLNKTGGGVMYTEQMPSQMNTHEYRYYWNLQDTHYIATPELTVGYKFEQVSDNNYFVDFGNFYSGVNNINLERSAFINYAPKWFTTGVKVQGYQTIQPVGQSSTPVYATLPQVNFNLNPLAIGDSGFKFNMINQYTNFTANQINNVDVVQTGQRIVVYPSINYPYQNQWSYVTPKLGYNFTSYYLNPFQTNLGGSSSAVNRGLPVGSIDSGLIFDRPITLFRSNYVQTLEPRLYYLYIPTVEQGNIPTFDTAQSSPNLNELFSENRFSGYDRVNAANDITVGVSSKLINDNNGVEFMNFGVGYRYYINRNINQQIGFIYGDVSQFQQLYQPQPNLIAEISNKWLSTMTTSANFQYNTVYQIIDGYMAQMQYKDESARVLNARFSYTYNMPIVYYTFVPGQSYPQQTNFENQYALNLSGQLPIYYNKWLLEAGATYDFTRSDFLNILGGLEYNGGCWSVRALYENFIGTTTSSPITPQRTDIWYLQFTLNGLTSFGKGGDPTGDLQLRIPGYVPVTNIR